MARKNGSRHYSHPVVRDEDQAIVVKRGKHQHTPQKRKDRAHKYSA